MSFFHLCALTVFYQSFHDFFLTKLKILKCEHYNASKKTLNEAIVPNKALNLTFRPKNRCIYPLKTYVNLT